MTDAQTSSNTVERPKYLAHVRHSSILDEIIRHGSVTVSALAQQLAVSDMTIRRDLVELEKAGKLARTHGGAIRVKQTALSVTDELTDRVEPAFDRRQRRNAELKRRIAAIASQIAGGSRSVAVDVGTTTYMLAEMMDASTHTKVFTNNIRASMQLASKGVEVYLAGGRIREEEMSTSGPAATEQFGSLWFDVAFIGVSGVTGQGAYDYSLEEADMKRLYLRRATRKIMLCDSTKFERVSLVNVAPLAEFTHLITDKRPPEGLAADIARAGVEIIVAN